MYTTSNVYFPGVKKRGIRRSEKGMKTFPLRHTQGPFFGLTILLFLPVPELVEGQPNEDPLFSSAALFACEKAAKRRVRDFYPLRQAQGPVDNRRLIPYFQSSSTSSGTD